MPKPSSDPAVLPLIEEELRVGHERVDTAVVRVAVDAEETVQTVPLDTIVETTEVERVRVDRPVSERSAPWHEGDVLVVPVYEERVVVQRVLVLAEEVRLRQVRTRHTEDLEVVLRKERARVERHALGEAKTRSDDTNTAAPRAAAVPTDRRSRE